MSEPTANDAVREQLSAFLDGELPIAEMQLLLKRLERDTDLRRAFGRYVLTGEAMRATGADGPTRQFAERIAAAIQNEGRQKSRWQSARTLAWLKPAAGIGIAAGVATVAVMVMRAEPRSNVATSPGVADAQLVATTGNPPTISPQQSYVVPMQVNAPAAGVMPPAQLTNYVVAHSEFSSPLGRRNVLTGILADEDLAESQAQEQASQNASKKSASFIEQLPAR